MDPLARGLDDTPSRQARALAPAARALQHLPVPVSSPQLQGKQNLLASSPAERDVHVFLHDAHASSPVRSVWPLPRPGRCFLLSLARCAWAASIIIAIWGYRLGCVPRSPPTSPSAPLAGTYVYSRSSSSTSLRQWCLHNHPPSPHTHVHATTDITFFFFVMI